MKKISESTQQKELRAIYAAARTESIPSMDIRDLIFKLGNGTITSCRPSTDILKKPLNRSYLLDCFLSEDEILQKGAFRLLALPGSGFPSLLRPEKLFPLLLGRVSSFRPEVITESVTMINRNFLMEMLSPDVPVLEYLVATGNMVCNPDIRMDIRCMICDNFMTGDDPAGVFHTLGNEAYDDKNYKDATIYYSASLFFGEPDAVTLLMRAWCYQGLGLLEAAVADLNASLTIDPVNTDAIFTLGCLYQAKGDFSIASLHFQLMLDGNPEDEQALYRLAFTLFLLKDYVPAATQFDLFSERYPEKASAWYYKGMCYYFLGDWEYAARDLKTAFELAPDNNEAVKYHRLALLHLHGAVSHSSFSIPDKENWRMN